MIAGLVLGVTGSMHCIGMCGPLSLALPMYHLPAAGRTIALLLYQFGRVVTYSFIGLMAGFAGRGFWRSGYQQWFSIGLGISILILAFLYFMRKKRVSISLLDGWYRWVQKMIMKILERKNRYSSFLLLGMANGLLPCGMVYLATAAALTFNNWGYSAAFMAFFGLGTLPAMMLIAVGGRMISLPARLWMKKAVPYFIAFTGLLLILRGLNLGIPFISPHFALNPGEAIQCHP